MIRMLSNAEARGLFQTARVSDLRKPLDGCDFIV